MAENEDAAQEPLMRAREAIDGLIAWTDRMTVAWPTRLAGWAPESSGEILKASRLDRVASLSRSLVRWVEPTVGPSAEGDLILAWVTLGAVVEGTLKFFVAVFVPDYDRDPQTRNARLGVAQKIERKNLGLKELRDLFAKKIWLDMPFSEQRAKFDPLVELIQHGRNGIHAFEERKLPTHDGFLDALSLAREMCEELDGRLPSACQAGEWA